MRAETPANTLAQRLEDRSARVAVLGLGYTGLPLAVALAEAGFPVTGLDIDTARVSSINRGISPIPDVPDAALKQLTASTDLSALGKADCALICVPTPLTPDREPDFRFIEAARDSLAPYLHPGMLIVLQSTGTPGTTRNLIANTLAARSGLTIGRDFFVAYAPERIDPGNPRYHLGNTPKLVGGMTAECTRLATMLFAPAIEHIIPVSAPEVAEMAKLIENTFRFINISFMNEMAMLCDRMSINVWEVAEAAGSKPFGYMSHSPGPGVGGECIPVVPFFLEQVAQDHDMAVEFIEVSGRVNDEMPQFTVDKLDRLLKQRGKPLAGTRLLVLGVAYKPDIADVRESPALRVLELLLERGACVEYLDPHVPAVQVGGKRMESLTPDALAAQTFECAILLTGHKSIDYALVARQSGWIFDTRNQFPALPDLSIVRI